MALMASQYYSTAGIRRPILRTDNLPGGRRRTYKFRHRVCRLGRNFSSVEAFAGLDCAMNKPMRKVVDHLVLLKMKEDLTEEQETTMLDNVYTLQYHFRGILCVSLGRILSENQERCTHGILMRFASKDLLLKYNEHPTHSKVAKEFVLPYCNGFITADFEAEVEDSLEPLFRRGEEFESGIEHIILLKVSESASADRVQDMLQSLCKLAEMLPTVLVQLTAGVIFSAQNQGYTHAIVARLPSGSKLFNPARSSQTQGVFSYRGRIRSFQQARSLRLCVFRKGDSHMQSDPVHRLSSGSCWNYDPAVKRDRKHARRKKFAVSPGCIHTHDVLHKQEKRSFRALAISMR
ncbi:stress-response A/B barrel domain-containing protein UP3 isoform X2 [Selaginella moellendorffii]|uniref:stress-response A/B barrel domain-containing protein UP3 isoform X2 n=1 Tax=Selaginella moellendorffii TaxID=88036 RepID=UPI000D1D00FD|nr:stress-response A/B barrel domain-containing protein UP3 isoform X2 [Selaginella moellendorffii]|eukprot:XP_024520979.1 stress-response A/B barrel domain-containing protein UP3 isoform X2 [Selaginella moellendorffii]